MRISHSYESFSCLPLVGSACKRLPLAHRQGQARGKEPRSGQRQRQGQVAARRGKEQRERKGERKGEGKREGKRREGCEKGIVYSARGQEGRCLLSQRSRQGGHQAILFFCVSCFEAQYVWLVLC